jgi:hypothetical protein
MTTDHFRFALWSAIILAVAVAAIVYQHAQHTAYILASMGGAPAPDDGQRPGSIPVADPAATTGANPNWSGLFSRARGQWTPLGPPDRRFVFPYRPGQNW